MADNDTSSTGSETPNVDTPVTGTPASSGVTPDSKPNVTLEAALARIAELEHAHKNAREQAERHAKKLTAYEKAEQDKKDAELSEIERLKKQHTELQSQHEAYKQQMQARNVRYEVEKAATKLNIIDPDAAFKLIDRDDLEYDDNGDVTNAEKLLEKLLKQKPYLAPKQPDPQEETPASPPTTKQSVPALPAMNPGRSSIAAPDSMPNGSQISIQDAYRLARERR